MEMRADVGRNARRSMGSGVVAPSHRAVSVVGRPVLAAARPLGYVLLLFVAAAGCSDGRPTRVPVSGRVLIDGEPIKMGSIRFVPEGARPSAADLDAEGRFTLRCFDGDDGAVLGTHRVQVAAREVKGESVRWYAPTKYSDYRSSGLTVEITEPTDSLVIELTWGGKKPRGK